MIRAECARLSMLALEISPGDAYLDSVRFQPAIPTKGKQVSASPDWTAMNARKEPAMATTPESFVDALNAAFGKQTTQRARF